MKSEKQKEPVYHFLESPYFQSSVQRLDHIMRDRKDICSQRIGGGGRKGGAVSFTKYIHI